jgi:ubiquinone/menaquinone biosynthesis C-methylase UbiE
MNEVYASPEDYRSLFRTLTRSQVAARLQLGPNVLDIAAGSGYFSIEVASQHPHTTLVAIDLFPESVTHAKKNIAATNLAERLTVLAMDASNLGFRDEGFDTVVNYLGLEDIHMTRGYRGIQQTFQEAHRVLKPGGRFYFVALPPDAMETTPQQLEVALFSWLCGATWLNTAEYRRLVDAAGLVFTAKTAFYTGKKLAVEQAREEINYACTYAPLHYGVQTPKFQDAWTRYGPSIQRCGLGHYSKTVLFETTKPLP